MKSRIFKGQIFLDVDGDEIEVIRINESSVILRTADSEVIAADADSILQDIQSGDLVPLDDE